MIWTLISSICIACTKHHLEELCKQFKWILCSREQFQWLKDTPPETLTDIQRAARFLYLQKMCFGGRNTGRTFGTATTAKPKFNLMSIEQDLSDAHMRLHRVFIEHLSWEFEGLALKQIDYKYTAGKSNSKKASKLVYCNFEV